MSMHLAPGKERGAIATTGISLGPADDYGVQPVAIGQHILLVSEKGRRQQADQHPEAEMIALVRRGGEQQQIAGMVPQRLGQLVILGLADFAARPRRRQMMGLVEDGQVKRRRFQDARDTGRALEGVDRDDQSVVPGKGVALAVGDIAFRARRPRNPDGRYR